MSIFDNWSVYDSWEFGLRMWEDEKQHKQYMEEQEKHTAQHNKRMELEKAKSRLHDKRLQYYDFMKEHFIDKMAPSEIQRLESTVDYSSMETIEDSIQYLDLLMDTLTEKYLN